MGYRNFMLACASMAMLALLTGCNQAAPGVAAGDNSAARGAQLVAIGGCDDCHTPKLPNGSPDMSLRMSGVPEGQAMPPTVPPGADLVDANGAFRGAWGLSLSRNLTPDPVNGIGNWTQAQFLETLRTGKDPSGHVLQPPMPWQSLGSAPDADLIAIYNFLMTVKPNSNKVAGP